ncbi:GntR family transcriptional regulator [Ferrovibrio sp.]|uniref:GntR family transcriptional regulator n=1 Tax=Ferrovibrio sp. TaxID=1917215 RepID=UPI003D2A7216
MAKAKPLRAGTIERPKSLTELVKEHIRTRIIDGELKLGEALSENVLAAQLGISKTPVREALLQLKLEGLVDIQPQRGSFVFTMNPKEMEEFCDYRIILETAALRSAIENDEAGLVVALDQRAKKMVKALEENDLSTYRRIDTDYHRQILQRAQNSYLLNAHSQLEMKIQALRAHVTQRDRSIEVSLAEHLSIVKLLKANDKAKALTVLSGHIRAASRDFRALSEEGGSLG